MSLQFIIGNSGSGKSTYLYQKVIAESMERPGKNFLVIVPEQFTMQTQKEFVRLHPRHAIMNIEILSFERLAYRVFDELGTDTLTVLEETGKNLLLRRIAGEKQKELKVLSANMKKRGYISEIKSLISELSQYHISPDDFREMMECPAMSEAFRCKAADILVMYQSFLDEISGRYITSEALLELLTEVVADSSMVRSAVLAFDGFTGFTPIQHQLLYRLLSMTEKTFVTVTCDVRENFFGEYQEEELFAMSKKMIRRIADMAKDAGVLLEKPVICKGERGKRFVSGGCLEHLEQNLFRRETQAYESKEHVDDVFLYSMADPTKELEFVAGEICGMIRTGGYRYRDFAVVCADLAGYRYLVQRIFSSYQLPFFLDVKTDIVFHPFTEFISSALELAQENFSYESVFRFLRSGLTNLSDQETDELENYVLRAGIRGFSRYRSAFAVMPKGYTPEDLVALNAIREKFLSLAEPFYLHIRGKQHTVTKISAALYELIVSCDIQRRLRERSRLYEQEGNEAKAREYSQIYGIVMDLLDKMVFLLGEEQMSLEEYQEILESGFDAAKIGVIPPGQDCVMVGDIERTRLDHIKVLYLVGANDGAIPAALGRGGIFSQIERRQLKEADFELAPTDREKAFMQKFYLYLMLTKPSEKLVVSYARVGISGSALRKSYLIQTLSRLFPHVSITELFCEHPGKYLMTEQTLHAFTAEALQQYVLGEEQPGDAEDEKELRRKEWERYLGAALSWYKSRGEQERIQPLLEAAFFHHKEETVGRAAEAVLTGSGLTGSVTRLEQFARCAYAYFLTYGLKLSERGTYALEAVDVGNLYHEALERYCRLLESEGESWFDISEDRREVLLQRALLLTWQNLKKTEILENARDTYVLKRMESTLRQTVWALTKQIRKGKFVPRSFEVDFSSVEDLDALCFALDEMHKIQLRGKIDRLDTYETEDVVYVKIVDYKSGHQKFDLLSFYHGLQLQLVLYLGAAVERMEKKFPQKKVVPGAMFYYHIDDPFVDGRKYRQQEEIDQARLEQMKMQGIVNSSDQVIEALDMSFEKKSDVIPVFRKKDGTLSSASSVLDTKQLETMEKYVQKKVTETGKQILSGQFDCRPFRLDQKTGCDYCPYHSVCGFDPALEGYEYRRLEKLKSQEQIFERMREKLEENMGGEKDGGTLDEGSAAGNRGAGL